MNPCQKNNQGPYYKNKGLNIAMKTQLKKAERISLLFLFQDVAIVVFRCIIRM